MISLLLSKMENLKNASRVLLEYPPEILGATKERTIMSAPHLARHPASLHKGSPSNDNSSTKKKKKRGNKGGKKTNQKRKVEKNLRRLNMTQSAPPRFYG